MLTRPLAVTGRCEGGEASGHRREDQAMQLVLLTAVATWVLMQVLNVVNVGGFLVESTIAVVGGAAIGFFGSWYLRRRARKERRG